MTKIILDPSGSYPPENHYIVITTEVEWLKYLTLEHEHYLIQGKTLCNWTEEWLRVWNKLDLIVEKKQLRPEQNISDFIPQEPEGEINNRYHETVIVNCVVQCEAQKPGELTITIYNYDQITLSNLYLTINELPSFENIKLPDFTIPPNDKRIHEMIIHEYPQLPPHKNKMTIDLSGKLTFNFEQEKSGESKLDSESYLTIKQIYNSGFQGDLNDF
ncbi:hypothetical protein A0J48_018085 [Sphaerospermopsis aphanizomenoides BCCUSP55]|uniref:hypothetical protein n=1 Tax=Sphaerospermopsis aphanizomenoides TaxID=459663 RepID=UPI001903660E|nr:hypothetical protein [Sphaerospermopsis aphanizomenoides]MBK1989420.1 hypothetical protein [Sphaerospermopsis aphanizomenoides BCCUSP55]